MADPYQLSNIHNSAPYTAVEGQFSRWLDRLRSAAGQSLRDIEQTPP